MLKVEPTGHRIRTAIGSGRNGNEAVTGYLAQSCPWVGLGWVGLGRDFSVFSGLGWVHYSKSTKNLKGLF